MTPVEAAIKIALTLIEIESDEGSDKIQYVRDAVSKAHSTVLDWTGNDLISYTQIRDVVFDQWAKRT